jgi:CHASE3 domain sensor protein
MDSKELEKLTSDIEGILALYSGLGADFKDIDRLIVAKRKLSGYLFRFSVLVGESLEAYNTSYAYRKSETAKKVLEYVSNGDAQFKASMKAEIDVKDMRLVEAGYESLYRRLKGQQEAINNTIASIMQDIKNLEREYNQTGN